MPSTLTGWKPPKPAATKIPSESPKPTLRIARSCPSLGTSESRDLTFTGENDLLYLPVGSAALAVVPERLLSGMTGRRNECVDHNADID
jgi:hypothetical protein